MVHEDRRKCRRISLTAEKSKRTIKIFNQLGLNEHIEGELLNISDNGLCLSVSEPLKEASIIKVMFSLTNRALTVPTLGEVRWVRQYDKEDQIFAAGIRFVF